MKWQLDRSPTKSRGTANKLRRTLVALRRWGLNEKDFPGKLPRVKPYHELKRVPQAWHLETVNRILVASAQVRGKVGTVPAHRWFPAQFLGIYNTGLRISAWMLTPTSGLDLARGTLLVPAEIQKQGADQLIQLLPITIEALAAIDPHRNARLGDDWAFDRTQNSWRALNRALKKILVAAGLFGSIDQIGKRELFHKLRRTHGSYVAKHASPDVARQSLGHSHGSVTNRYLDPEIVGGPQLASILPSPEFKLPLRVVRSENS